MLVNVERGGKGRQTLGRWSVCFVSVELRFVIKCLFLLAVVLLKTIVFDPLIQNVVRVTNYRALYSAVSKYVEAFEELSILKHFHNKIFFSNKETSRSTALMVTRGNFAFTVYRKFLYAAGERQTDFSLGKKSFIWMIWLGCGPALY